MTNKLKLLQRIAAIVLSVCLTHSVIYSQTPNTESPKDVVRLRSKIELTNPRGLVFSPVSKLLAVRREDGSVQIIDISEAVFLNISPYLLYFQATA